MPKYYITNDKGEQTILSTDRDEVGACRLAFQLNRLTSISTNSRIRVSQIGFGQHTQDIMVDTNKVLADQPPSSGVDFYCI